jgi:hypothetical protein
MTRTPTLPPNDRQMWRKLIARVHPDAGGEHNLFIWTQEIREHVCTGETKQGAPTPDNKPRVPYRAGTDFEEVTRTALGMGATGMPCGRLLSLLADCYPLDSLRHEQNRGASYKRLAAIGHAWGMSKSERVRWYRVAEDLPLSDRHAGHILSRLKRRS